MLEVPIVSLLSELGFKPTEVLILAMLWQNVRNTRVLLDKLVLKVNKLESQQRG
ncbi:hypothetical protein VB10N_03710 [Vibrio sp. 10N]|nr:hypothetical protein VB10N_03710 [Vibrio sp. 10N]